MTRLPDFTLNFCGIPLIIRAELHPTNDPDPLDAYDLYYQAFCLDGINEVKASELYRRSPTGALIPLSRDVYIHAVSLIKEEENGGI